MVKTRSTTVLAVIRDGRGTMAGDGQVTMNEAIVKQGARKLHRLYNDKMLAGFAGAGADCLTLLERFEEKLNIYSGNLARSAVELAKTWRTDKVLRHLDALLMVMNSSQIFLLSGRGDVIEPDEGIIAIGSGGNYALAAARALLRNTSLSSEDIARQAMHIAAEICVYTNDRIVVESV
ncbi:MAG TPA: ATP-dependent protease subunit HslV [Atribacteraceae bacterium]|nr:ATP-dependent protease subunit HslV [Atribacteraceae bacterium]